MKIKLLLILTFISISCTESVSEELRDGSSSSESGATQSNEYAFRVVSTSNSTLSHKLHKMGTISEECEIKKTNANFDATDYSKTGELAVDCVIDVEEFDLYFEGAKFEIQVDNRACEYVEYRPFRFFQFQPGRTTRTTFRPDCDEMCSQVHGELCNKEYDSFDTGTTVVSSMFNDELAQGHACEFDHSSRYDESWKAPNCDIGDVSVRTVEVNGYGVCNIAGRTASNCELEGVWTSASSTCSIDVHSGTTKAECEAVGVLTAVCSDTTQAGLGGAVTVNFSGEIISEECGGDIGACYAGHSVDVLDTPENSAVSGIYTQVGQDDESFRLEYEVESPFSKNYSTNRYIANYSRICSNTGVDKLSDVAYQALSQDGAEYETYTYRRGGSLISPNDVLVSRSDGQYTVYAHHPQLGVGAQGTGPRGVTQPYYGIYCLDESRDVRAQIRLHIREWDRSFSELSPDLQKVSDIYHSANPAVESRMDNNGISANDSDEVWNDILDWDDFYQTADTSPGIRVFAQDRCEELTTDMMGAPSDADIDMTRLFFPGINL